MTKTGDHPALESEVESPSLSLITRNCSHLGPEIIDQICRSIILATIEPKLLEVIIWVEPYKSRWGKGTFSEMLEDIHEAVQSKTVITNYEFALMSSTKSEGDDK